MPILKLENVSKVYSREHRGFLAGNKEAAPAIQALVNVSLAVTAGQSVGVIGESGAGKTTIAALAVGLTEPTSGRVLINAGHHGNKREDRLRRASKIQLIWQNANDSVDPRMRVRQIIGEPLKVHGLDGEVEMPDTIGNLLQEVGLARELMERWPYELSGCELQRVVIARALTSNPELLICDEPASALDAYTKVRVADLLVRLQAERGLALLVIAHDLPLVRMITDELIVMHEGSIVEHGPTESIINQPAHPYTQLLLSCDPTLSMNLPRRKKPGPAVSSADQPREAD